MNDALISFLLVDFNITYADSTTEQLQRECLPRTPLSLNVDESQSRREELGRQSWSHIDVRRRLSSFARMPMFAQPFPVHCQWLRR